MWALAGLVNDREEDVHREAAYQRLNRCQDLVEGWRGLSRW